MVKGHRPGKARVNAQHALGSDGKSSPQLGDLLGIYLTSLGLSFPTYKMGIMIPTSSGCLQKWKCPTLATLWLTSEVQHQGQDQIHSDLGPLSWEAGSVGAVLPPRPLLTTVPTP